MWFGRGKTEVRHTCLNSSRAGTRRGRDGGRIGKKSRTAEPAAARADTAGTVAAAAAAAAAVVVIGASVSGSVMVVNCDAFVMAELSNSELASGDIDLRATVAVGCCCVECG